MAMTHHCSRGTNHTTVRVALLVLRRRLTVSEPILAVSAPLALRDQRSVRLRGRLSRVDDARQRPPGNCWPSTRVEAAFNNLFFLQTCLVREYLGIENCRPTRPRRVR